MRDTDPTFLERFETFLRSEGLTLQASRRFKVAAPRLEVLNLGKSLIALYNHGCLDTDPLMRNLETPGIPNSVELLEMSQGCSGPLAVESRFLGFKGSFLSFELSHFPL